MTLLEAIEERHSVRKYKDEPIPEEVLTTLQNRIWEITGEWNIPIGGVSSKRDKYCANSKRIPSEISTIIIDGMICWRIHSKLPLSNNSVFWLTHNTLLGQGPCGTDFRHGIARNNIGKKVLR